jgi:hypothetical protein
VWPAQLIGLFAAIAGMIAGSLLPHFVGRPTPLPASHAGLHHHAAAQTHHVPPHPHHHHHDGPPH